MSGESGAESDDMGSGLASSDRATSGPEPLWSQANGRRPALTPEAERQIPERAFMAYDDGAETACIINSSTSNPAGPLMLAPKPPTTASTDGRSRDHGGDDPRARIIRDRSPRLPPHIRPWFGDSWGRWETQWSRPRTSIHNSLSGESPLRSTCRTLHAGLRRDDPLRVRPLTPTMYTQAGEVPLKK